jgi:hypothetical protein
MKTVKDELDKLGKDITADAKKNALPNKKTGQLDKSFSYDYTFINDEKFSLVINEKFYGKFLNNKTKYMDKAVEKNLTKGSDSIIDVMAGEFLNEIATKLK